MTQPAVDTTHPLDHGVHAFDPELTSRQYRVIAEGHFKVVQTTSGRFYLFVEVDTVLGHLCSAIHIERQLADSVREATARQLGQRVSAAESPSAAEVVGAIADRANHCAHLLQEAARAHQIPRPMFDAACLLARAAFGDIRARNKVEHMQKLAEAGDTKAQATVGLLGEARAFLVDVCGDEVQTAGLFDDIGKAVSHVARDVGKTASHIAAQVTRPAEKLATDVYRGAQHAAEKNIPGFTKIEHTVTDVVHTVESYGPMVLSSLDALCSLIPGIGTGISSGLEAGLAILQGGGPLDIAVHAAYGAIPIPPGIKFITDTVVSAVLALAHGTKNLTDVAVRVIRDRIPKGLPTEIFDTLISVIVHKRPVLKAASDSLGHYVTKYTQGATAAIADGLQHVGADVQSQLAKLPDPKLAFQSIAQIAPHLAAPQLPRPVTPQPMGGGASAVARTAAPVFRGASLAIEIAPDGASQRVVASQALAHLVASTSVTL